MGGFITAIIVTVIVFVIFGRDEEGRSRFERRKMRRMQPAGKAEAWTEAETGSGNRAA